MKLKISEGKRNKKKRSKGRPKKFEGESKVISFRIDKDVYEERKDTIRGKINGVIEEEVKKAVIKANDKDHNNQKLSNNVKPVNTSKEKVIKPNDSNRFVDEICTSQESKLYEYYENLVI